MITKFVYVFIVLQVCSCLSNAVPHGMGLDGSVVNHEGMEKMESSKFRGCICPAVYAPVCCRKGQHIYTASNSCECTCSKGATVVEGDCGLTFRPVLERFKKLLQ